VLASWSQTIPQESWENKLLLLIHPSL
jgi:hypothetical protein